MTTIIKKLGLRMLLECLVVGLLFAGMAAAQTFSGSIGGIVKDSSGGVVPGVKVVVTDKTTNVSVNVETNGAGVYTVQFLNPSTYQVTFTKEGFKTYVEETVPLVINQIARVDVVLVVGSTTQSVTVTAVPPALDKESAMIGGTASDVDLLKLPENETSHGPDTLVLVRIFPGLSGSSPYFGNPNDFSLAGGRDDTVPYIEDGLPSNMAADNTYGFVPTPDSTSEFQVLITPYSAQYGQTGGGAVLTTTKAGTNNLHGALFEYHDDEALNAIDFFTNAKAGVQTRPETVFNYFGGNAGGPVYIPGVWDGRKRHTFFFTDWEETIEFKPSLLDTTVPTDMEKEGNFSGPLPSGGTTPTIYNPATTTVSGSTITRTPFAGNIITTAEDPVGKAVMSYYPEPNCQISAGDNYCLEAVGYHSYLYNTDRVDQEIGDYDRLWFRFARDGPWTGAVQYIPNASNPNATNGWRDYHEEATWAHIFSPTITNEFRVGEVEEDNFTLANNQNVTTLGLVGVPPAEFPGISNSGIYSIGGQSPSSSIDRFQIFNDGLEMQRGHHSLHLGGEFIRYMFNTYSPGLISGSYTFNGNGTAETVSGKLSGGSGTADLYLGQVDSASISTNDYEFRFRLNYASLYFQDDWKLTPKLTLNLGLRWEFDGPATEVNNWVANMNPTMTDPTTGKLGAIEWAGRNGAPSNFISNDYHGFLPRVGFAYDLGHNTVVRAGGGFFELPGIGFDTNGEENEYSRKCSYVGSLSGIAAFTFSSGLTSSCPYNINSAGLPNIPSSLTSPTQTVPEFQLTPALPVLQEWSLSVQHQFPHGWLGEIDYIGNKGTKLPVTLPGDQIVPPSCCSQSLRPYPEWSGVNYYAFSGNSEYNGLILSMRHNWTHGLSSLVSYTWQKTMDDVDAAARSDAVGDQNVYDIAAQRGVAMIDVPQHFVGSFVWQVPLGAGGKFAQNVQGLKQVLGHWELSDITTFSSGYPYNISVTNNSGWYSGAQYATATGISNHVQNKTVAEWFNPLAYTSTASNTMGDTPRASLFGPGYNNFDISVSRNFPIREKVTLNFRADFYNAFNHVSFDNLNTTCTSTTTVNGVAVCSGAIGAMTGDVAARSIYLDARIIF